MVKCFAKGGAGDNRNLRLCANYLFICLLCLWATIVLVLTTVGGLMSKYLKLFQRCQQLCTTPYSRNVLNYSKGVRLMFSLCQGCVSGVWTSRTGHPGSDLPWKCESNIYIMSESLRRAYVRNSQIGLCSYVLDCFWIRTHNFQETKGKN